MSFYDENDEECGATQQELQDMYESGESIAVEFVVGTRQIVSITMPLRIEGLSYE